MSLCHSTTYSPKPLLTEGFSPPAGHHTPGRVASHDLQQVLPQAAQGMRHFGQRSFRLPCKTSSGTWLPFQTQVNHLSQLRETTKHVNPGEQSTAGSSGLMPCSLRGFRRAGHQGCRSRQQLPASPQAPTLLIFLLALEGLFLPCNSPHPTFHLPTGVTSLLGTRSRTSPRTALASPEH